jgi:hypothetical protein
MEMQIRGDRHGKKRGFHVNRINKGFHGYMKATNIFHGYVQATNIFHGYALDCKRESAEKLD